MRLPGLKGDRMRALKGLFPALLNIVRQKGVIPCKKSQIGVEFLTLMGAMAYGRIDGRNGTIFGSIRLTT